MTDKPRNNWPNLRYEGPTAMRKRMRAESEVVRAARRQAERDKAAKFKAECAALLNSSLTGRPLSAQVKSRIREKVLSGLHPLSRSTLGW